MNASLLLHVSSSISYNSKAAAVRGGKVSDFSTWLLSFTRISCAKTQIFTQWKQKNSKKLILKFQISVASVTNTSITTDTIPKTIGTTTSKCSREDWISSTAATATDSTVFQAPTTIQPAAAASNFDSRFQLFHSTFISLAVVANKLLTAKRTILHNESQSSFECCCWQRFVQCSTMGPCG